MSEITVLFRGDSASPFARMLSRALSAAGHPCLIAEAPTGEESFCIVDADSVPPSVYETLLPEATLLYTANAVPEGGIWASRTLLRPFSVQSLCTRLPKVQPPVAGEESAIPPIERLAF